VAESGGPKMVDNIQVVHIGGVVVSRNPDDILVSYGLGSCVVVCLYDPMAKVGGMLHALLPTFPNNSRRSGSPAKYVDQGVPLLVESMLAQGARRIWMKSRLCGGAQMLHAQALITKPGPNGRLNVGQRNVQAAEAALRAAGIRLHAQATGGSAGRTIRLYLADGRVTVKTLGKGEQVLA